MLPAHLPDTQPRPTLSSPLAVALGHGDDAQAALRLCHVGGQRLEHVHAPLVLQQPAGVRGRELRVSVAAGPAVAISAP